MGYTPMRYTIDILQVYTSILSVHNSLANFLNNTLGEKCLYEHFKYVLLLECSSKVKDLLNLNVYTKKVANFTKSVLYYCVKF